MVEQSLLSRAQKTYAGRKKVWEKKGTGSPDKENLDEEVAFSKKSFFTRGAGGIGRFSDFPITEPDRTSARGRKRGMCRVRPPSHLWEHRSDFRNKFSSLREFSGAF